MAEKNYKREFPLNGKLVTALDASQVGDNFVTLKNLRYKKAGVSPIGGMTKINTSAIHATCTEPTSAFHFRKSDPSESHILVESTDGATPFIFENQTAIPSAGNFETSAIYTVDTSSNGGRWSDAPNGMVAYANGKEACLWGGDEMQVGSFITSSAAVTNTATDPKDYTEQVRNSLTSASNRVALAGTSYWLVGSVMPLKGVKFYLSLANSTVGAITVEEWDGSAWSGLTVTDNTASGGATLAQTGTMTWASTASTSKMRMIYGVMLYWYQFSVTVGTCSIYRVTLDAPFQTIKDSPDGIDRGIFSFLQYSAGQYTDKTIGVSQNEYDSNNTGTFSELDSLSYESSVYCGFEERISGLNINVVPDHNNSTVGSTMTVAYWDGSAFQSVTGLVDGTSEGEPGSEMVTNGDCSVDSFNKGVGWAHDTDHYDCDGSQVADSDLSQDVSASASTSYLVTYTLSNVSAGTITPKLGTTEGDSKASDGTYSVVIIAQASTLYLTADSNFIGTVDDVSVKPLTETTLNRSGVISWAAISEDGEFKTEITNSIPLYYYKLTFSLGTDADTQVYYVSGVPTQKTIKDIEFPLFANDRLWLCKDNHAQCSLAETATVFNGSESRTLYFGNDDHLTGGAWIYSQFGASIYNITLFFKANETWAIIGSDPETWQKYRVSSVVGCSAPNTIVIADISETGFEGVNRSVAIWQGANGIYLSDGRQPILLSADIEDLFDKRQTSSINQSKIGDSVGFWDADNFEYHWLFAKGSSIDTEYVFSFKKKAFFEVERTTSLLCGIPVKDTNGATYTYGLIDGYLERLEYGNTMDGNDIDFDIRFGDVALMEGSVAVETRVSHHALIAKAKTTTTNSITLTHYVDSESSGTAWTESPQKSGHRLIFPVEHYTSTGIFHSWRIQATTNDETYGFEPLFLTILYSPQRDNTRDRR